MLMVMLMFELGRRLYLVELGAMEGGNVITEYRTNVA